MLNKGAKRLLVRTIIAVSIVYFGSFGILTYLNELPWLNRIIQSFMGAGAIALITVIIVVFQNQVQTISKKKERIFDQRLNLYKATIDLFWDVVDRKQIDISEHNQFKANNQKMLLLAGKKVYVQFNALLIMINTEFRSSGKDKIDIAKLTNPDGEQFASLFKKFVTVCREDLDIDDQLIDPADDEQFEEFVDLSTKMISDDLGVDQD
ncbi:uncharacterized protein METZ01_LOCUS182533 [marine metagenome]|uniref:Uncharacterized protein n=1 Tax=marine metagenome TaxID=408172 RepID=A0A382CUX6_9ZZZZ